ncbi:MAG: hemerythrin domain-containing protein [Bacillota bacterium]|nr:hemerythrin domain-containing protein [Bacillota bacterium]
MNGIALMVEEHKLIKRMLKVIRKASFILMKEDRYEDEDFRKMIDFVRNFADAHHHGKEEDFLFNRMISEIGGVAEKLVRNGMLVEHDLGRLHMKQLEEALNKVQKGDEEAKLDIIANAVSYTDLLTRHIDKEDKVAYTFAENNLKKDTIDIINEDCKVFEKKQNDKGIQKKYEELVEGLEEKYLN